METAPVHSSLHALTFEILDEINGDFCKDEVLVRLIHFWEARNFKKGNILIGMELLLLDSQSNAVQGFISANRLYNYERYLKRNSVFKLQKFMVTPSKKFYKVSDHKHNICFTDKTTMIPLPQGDHLIDEQKFRIRLISGDNLHSPTTMETSPDVVGTRASDRVFLHLLMKDGQTVRLYLWGNIAATFRERWNQSGVKPVVLLITTVNPKTIGAAVIFSSTSSTRLFFDAEVDETKQFLIWLGANDHKPPTVTSASSAITKLETVTINEIHQFLQNKDPQEASFECFATVVDILPQSGWYYISCSTCNTKLEKSEKSMYCTSCNKYNNVGLIRYRFEITVRDKNPEEATFVVFDRDGTKLAGRRAADVLNESPEAVGDDLCVRKNTKTPECLKHIIGNTFKFQLKVTPFNFKGSRQTATVSRIIDKNISLDTTLGEDNTNTEVVATGEKTREKVDFTNLEESTGKKQEKRPRLDN